MQRKAAEDPIARRSWEEAGSAQSRSRAEAEARKSQGGDVKKAGGRGKPAGKWKMGGWSAQARHSTFFSRAIEAGIP